ncbi:hypothetical protein SUGI_0306940 [Cryptomeria japonica]|uniref:LOB domain-containing protein 1 n=1 Tax=Cryptomeria japonica TaxID=3369 RepID=UPI002408EE90|nr:LOB domain-containing protein 1 [Cryptomeria japonica]XP_057853079.2 LOB domain-containing protein 1 [Cryptomeria japonica]GLJ17626.1 hypothetical protein SUGI_0306940 [Cryptomeria japonica]
MAARNYKPCASCKKHWKKCSESCIMVPHFPSTDPNKFALVHRVFGTSHVLKTLQGIEDCERGDAVNSMVREARARVEGPVHGCTKTIHQLREQIAELEVRLAAMQEEVSSLRLQRDQMASFLLTGFHPTQEQNHDFLLDDVYKLLGI